MVRQVGASTKTFPVRESINPRWLHWQVLISNMTEAASILAALEHMGITPEATQLVTGEQVLTLLMFGWW